MAKAGLLFVGTDDGMVLFSNPNNIGRWLRIGHVLRGHAIQATWLLADNPLVVFAAVSGMGPQRSDDGGQSWQQALDAEIRTIVGIHSAPQTIYLGALDGHVYRSLDAGSNWEPCPRGQRPDGVAVTQLAVAHNDAGRLYAGLADGQIWTSADGGETWAGYGAAALPAAVAGLAAAPGPPGLLYAIAAGSLYHCTGADSSWEQVYSAPGAAGPLTILAGKNYVLLLATIDGAIVRSDDGGSTWALVGGELDWDGGATTIVSVGYHIDTAFAGSAGGKLLTSTDRGRTWQLLKQDLPPIRSIAAARLA
jgi:photosystem II stability/assembly factor-like uncharacterized protein